MGYAEHIKRLLAPMRVYELESGFGAAELGALGAELDALQEAAEALERESSLPTAEGLGLERLEALLPYRPEAAAVQDRRAAIAALLGIERDSFTAEAMSRALTGCGVRAEVAESGESMRVRVSFPGVRGIPDGIENLKMRIEAILPCHLIADYAYSYLVWSELEGCFSGWDALESAVSSWSALEKYMEA